MTTPANPASSSSITVDDRRWPLVVTTFRGVATERQFCDYLARQSSLLRRHQKNVVVIDAMDAGPPPASQRKQQAEWQRNEAECLRLYGLGTAFAIGSPLVRGALTAILWVQPLENPHYVASSRADAVSWAIHRLASAGLEAPP